MPDDPIVPQPTDPPPDPPRGKTILCECCGSKLDRHGDLLRRGDLAKQMIDAEDTIVELRKQLTKSAEAITAAKARVSELEAAQPAAKKSLWSREA